jgi:UDP-N-acetyl-D-mannosaminuronic acid transferase (WecB/TagA/CpsF family)
MGQRVNISYSIDIEELPQAVTNLITKAQAEIEALTAANKDWDIDFLSLETLAKITTLRETMSKADYILNDVSNIINGYIHYQTQPAQPTMPTTDLATDMDGLEAKLAQFKNAFGQPGSDEVTD